MTRIFITLAATLLFCGCQPKPEAPATGQYGPLTNAPRALAAVVKESPAALPPWTNGPLAVLESALSPATLWHANATTLTLFTPDSASGLGAPTHICFSTEQGPKIFKAGDKIDPQRMRESWLVIWWSGARGWTNWDAPFLLTLQHRPAAMELTTNGLQFKFLTNAGHFALLPLYGLDKSLPESMQSHPFTQAREKKKRVLTWEWHKALPADPLSRARYWASALKEFPIACDESFSVDRARDAVTLRSSFRWVSWRDDWNTQPLKLAPVSPVLGLALQEKFPAEFSPKPFDMEIATPFGPLYGVQEADAYEVTLPVLRYVHETGGLGGSNAVHALSYEMWRQAHTSGDWELARKNWPTVRQEFLNSASPSWPGFARVRSQPLHQTASALGTARLAYRLGDAETYALACARFARALTQLAAQQRGMDYFRLHQPWHSMTPLAPGQKLFTPQIEGWTFTNAKDEPALNADLARLWRAAQPMTKDSAAPAPAEKLERLIPGYTATGFISFEETGASLASLAARLEMKPAGPAFVWPDWKTPAGGAWSFGSVSVSPKPSAAPRERPLTSHTRALVYPAP